MIKALRARQKQLYVEIAVIKADMAKNKRLCQHNALPTEHLNTGISGHGFSLSEVDNNKFLQQDTAQGESPPSESIVANIAP